MLYSTINVFLNLQMKLLFASFYICLGMRLNSTTIVLFKSWRVRAFILPNLSLGYPHKKVDGKTQISRPWKSGCTTTRRNQMVRKMFRLKFLCFRSMACRFVLLETNPPPLNTPTSELWKVQIYRHSDRHDSQNYLW